MSSVSVKEVDVVEAMAGLASRKPSVEAATRGNICIVTSAPVCCNPRVVKEADALSAAGFDVRVVASQHVSWVVEWDAELMKGRKWKLDAVRWDGSDAQSKWTRLKTGVRQQTCQILAKGIAHAGIKERAFSRLYSELLRKATSERADFYIAHNPAALPVAAAAAERFGVRFAFDSEDFHTGEFSDAERDSNLFHLLCESESTYLPRCAYVTTPSEQISEALRSRYGVPTPTTLHNVFSWSDRRKLDGLIKDRRGDTLSLYWYSQIVGLDRGLQDVIRAAALLSTPVQMHLRGEVSDDVKKKLVELAAECRVAEQIFFHPPVPPEELLSRAVEHDVGLALEQPVNQNRNITVTNKLFFYMLAGISVAATGTEGQKAIMQSCPDAGLVYGPGDYQALAKELQLLIDSPDLLKSRKRASLSAAREEWNWEEKSRDLIDLVSSALSPKQDTSFVI